MMFLFAAVCQQELLKTHIRHLPDTIQTTHHAVALFEPLHSCLELVWE